MGGQEAEHVRGGVRGGAKDDAVAVAGHFLDCQCWRCEGVQEISVDEVEEKAPQTPQQESQVSGEVN